MKLINLKTLKKIFIIVVIMLIPLLISQFVKINENFTDTSGIHNTLRISAEYAYQDYYDTPWLSNSGFSSQDSWYGSQEGGDSSDVNQSISGGSARYVINGEERTFSDISGVPKNNSDWTPVNNTEIKYEPDDYEINSKGCWVTHRWEDGADAAQLNAIQWDRNITLEVDMTDYNITAISLSATANATVNANDGANAGIEILGEHETGYQNCTGDFVRFYIYISDIYKNQEYEIAFLQPDDLGIDSAGEFDYLYNTSLTVLSVDNIRNLIKSLLLVDPEHKTFIFSLGIIILSEDDYNNDEDIWDELIINSCDFSFTYEKIINPLTTISWNQDGPKISSVKYNETNNITLLGASLTFQYRISEPWPSRSPNTQIIMFINNNQNPITIYLENKGTQIYTVTFDVLSLLSVAVDYVNFSIQLYIGDTFGENNNIIVYIDNINLFISYREIGVLPPIPPGIDWTPAIIALTVGIIGAIMGLVSYILYFQYPPLVRQVRARRRKIKGGRSLKKPVEVEDRGILIRNAIRERLNVLKIEPGMSKGPSPIK